MGYKTEMALRMPGVQQSTAFSANSRPDGLVENVSLLCSQVVNPFSPTHQVSRIFQTPDWTLDMVNNKEEKVRQCDTSPLYVLRFLSSQPNAERLLLLMCKKRENS